MQKAYPYLIYENIVAAPEFLTKAFGFSRAESTHSAGDHADHGPAEHSHVEMDLGDGLIVRMSAGEPGYQNPRHCGHSVSLIQVYIDDAEPHFLRAKEAGATIVEPLQRSKYGDLTYTVDDPEGHRWHFVQQMSV